MPEVPVVYDALGGAAACRKLSVAFYARVKQDPILRPLFPGKTLKCAIEEFSAFLVQFLGGPSEDSQRRWWLSLRESHQRFKIGQKERDAWLKNMQQTLQEIQLHEPTRTALLQFFQHSSAYVANVDQVFSPAPFGQSKLHTDLTRRWNKQLNLDEAVAAIRNGQADRAIALSQSFHPPLLTGLLAAMIASRNSTLLDHVRETLRRNPTLTQERYNSRTLLHTASAAADLPTVELLLRLGANPNVTAGGSHTPLYSTANECSAEGGGNIVRTLVQAGANVDACDGVKRCTALHMASRRGNCEVAQALLDCGANIEARDSLGETPLRRAVNCGKTEVASLLLSKGADRHSKGSRGLTPLLAARTAAMKQLLRNHGSQQEGAAILAR